MPRFARHELHCNCCHFPDVISRSAAQAGTAESVCGIVQDQSGASVSRAALELRTANTRLIERPMQADSFAFRPLEPGEYEFTVQARGFRTNQQQSNCARGESHGA